MKHEFLPSEHSVDRLRPCLTMRHIQTSSKPKHIQAIKSTSICDVEKSHAVLCKPFIYSHILTFSALFKVFFYPLKSCSSTQSPSTRRNSVKAGVSSLFPNNSSSEVCGQQRVSEHISEWQTMKKTAGSEGRVKR